MKLIVGLGNPGEKYVRTRHNAGKNLITYIAHKNALSFAYKKKFNAEIADFNFEGNKVCLAYPATYMNLSGEALGVLVRYFDLHVEEDLLVVIDDFALPFGKIRLRGGGSSGGHNGLKSIDAVLGTGDYARLRIGIAPQDENGEAGSIDRPLENYVLEAFSPEEVSQMPEIYKKGEEACSLWLTQPIGQAMSTVNS